MYTPSYGFPPASNAPYNPQNPPGQQQQHQQQHHQQQPHMQHQQQQMYNPQHPYGGPPQSHQSPYNNAPAGMGGNGGMMQNTGLAHASGGGAGHVGSPYQTPYTSSPYGASIPTSAATTLPPQQYLPNTTGPPAFQMSMPSMQQRMQPPTSSTPQPRTSPYGGAPQGTPPNATAQQSQFSTPQQQPSNPTHHQTPNNNQQQTGGIVTPQTPNFPPGAQGTGGAGSQIATPLSPGSEAREKERVSLLLEINGELLRASIRIQSVQKEIAANTATSPDTATAGEKEAADKEKAEKDKAQNHKEWNEYMRRLQCNLAYLAAIADRSHKPSSQIPPHPGIMSAPPPRKPNSPSTSSPAKSGVKSENGDAEEDRDSVLKEQYERLQSLFPGVDPKKDPQIQVPKKPQQAPTGDQNQAMLKAQMQQRMVQEQQAKQQQQLQQQQAQAQAQAQAQGMAGRS